MHLQIRCSVFAVCNDGLHDYQDSAYPEKSFGWREIVPPFYTCLCDGVSGAYKSKAFADVVSLACGTSGTKAVTEPKSVRSLGDKWIAQQFKEIDDAYPNAIDINKREKILLDRDSIYHRRAATTLNILEIKQDEAVVSSYGDTVCFHIRGKEIIAQNPPLSADEFTNLPYQINTDTDHLLQSEFITSATPIQTGDILLLATDALAQWLVSDSPDLPQEKRIKSLISISSDDEFDMFIGEERKNKRIHNDDTTMMKIEIKFTGD